MTEDTQERSPDERFLAFKRAHDAKPEHKNKAEGL
jgi:hypothetical protein